MFKWVCISVCVYLCAYVCIFACTCACILVFIWVCIFGVYKYVCMFEHVYFSLCVCVFVSWVFVCLCAFVGACMYVNIYLYVCAHECLYVCMCLCGGRREVAEASSCSENGQLPNGIPPHPDRWSENLIPWPNGLCFMVLAQSHLMSPSSNDFLLFFKFQSP